MQEIRCPKCNEVFQVDDSGYSQIVQQVRDKEFEKEAARRAEELEKQLSDSDTELASLRITASEAQSELAALKEQLAGAEAQKSDGV